MSNDNRDALLIIDMLNDFFRDGLLADRRAELTQRINRLIVNARERGCKIIWVRQQFQADLSDAFAVMRQRNLRVTIAGTVGCDILSELDRQPHDHEIMKKRYSAFFGTALDQLLRDLKVKRLVLAGVNTHACVRTTAIDAYQRDYGLVVVRDCVASYDQEHHDVTLRYLGKDIAKVVELDELILDA